MTIQEHADATLFRVAVAALNYSPDDARDEGGYAIDDEIAWCLQPLRSMAPDTAAALEQLVRDAIIDPTAHRERLCDVLDTITEDG